MAWRPDDHRAAHDMTSPQHERVRELVAHESPTEADKPAVAGWLQRVCRAASRDLPAKGVGISLLSEGRDPLPVAAANDMSAKVEDLQFLMGEGPCIDAYASRSPVLVPDLAAAATTWPAYVPAALAHGVRAVFAFPLQIGAARLGAMDLYRDHPGGLTPDALSRALTFAEVTMDGLLDGGLQGVGEGDSLDDLQGNRLEIYQAQGMLMAQLGVDAEHALVRLRAYAYAHGRPAIDVARDIIVRKLSLESDA